MSQAAAVLEFNNVSYTYRGDWLQKIQALHSVSFQVPKAAAFGFLGANGAGKSTSIKLLTGLLSGHRGEIRLFGEPIGRPALRQRIGYLPEHPYFYERLKVGEYLRYLARLSGVPTAQQAAASDRVLEMLDLADLRDRQLGSFSKGMRQRFGLAQAIVHQPDLLVLDEPFSGLDPLWRARFREVLHAERQRGATLFFSSHILTDVEDLCDHYAVIDHGRVLEHGPLAHLLGQAPLCLVGSGPRPAGATACADAGEDTWQVQFSEADREQRVAEVIESGATILRLERQRQALEDYFVARVQASHGARKQAADTAPQPDPDANSPESEPASTSGAAP